MRCKDCPGSDEEAKVVVEAFGLQAQMYTGGDYHILWQGQLRRPAGPVEIAMWHALVRCYHTLTVDQYTRLRESA